MVDGPAPNLYASPAPATSISAADPWAANAVGQRGQNGESFEQVCPPGTVHTVWGTDVYTDDSSICSAAVHAGRINAAEGGRVMYVILPSRDLYFGTDRHGVTTLDYGAFGGSFAFDRTPQEPHYSVPEGARLVNSTFTASALRGTRVANTVYCPPNLSFRTVWGTGEYTDDSSVCTAAVHAGRIDAQRGGTVTFRPQPGRPSYRGSTAHGVTTTDYGAFDGGFAFE